MKSLCVCVCEGEKKQGKECYVTELITVLAGQSVSYIVILSCPSSPALANTATHSYCN